MSEASVPDQSESISDKLVVLAGNEHHDVVPGDLFDHWHRLWHDAATAPVLGWFGPLTFARTYGAAPGFDQDFGTSWGPNGDQRISLRTLLGDDAGLLYVYDPTWDEYAILGTDLQLVAIEDAFARLLRGVEHPALEDLIALLPTVPAARPSPGPES